MNSAPLKAFGKRIRALREKIGLSQEELAEKVGIHRTYIGSVERGERNIGILNVIRIASTLNTTASALLKEID